MTNIPISEYLGATEPTPNISGSQSTLYQSKPTLSEVVGAQVSEIFTGAGSLDADLAADFVRQQEKYGTRISEEEWRKSENYRDGLTYFDGITDKSSKLLADRYDDRQNNALILEKASRLQKAAALGAGLVIGIVEPKNLVIGIAATLITGGVGAVVPSVGRVIAVDTVRAAATRGAAEGVVAAALTEPTNLISAKKLQEDYTFSDSLLNLALGSVLGAGIGAGGKALELRTASKRELLNNAIANEEVGIKIKELDTAIAQTVQGTPVDVSAVKQLELLNDISKGKLELLEVNKKIAQLTAQEGVSPNIAITPVIRNLEELQGQYTNIKSNISEDAKFIQVNKASVPQDLRNSSLGQEFFTKLLNYADTNNKPVYITPSKTFGLSGDTRSMKAYAAMGFVKNVDTTKENLGSLVRYPKPPKYSKRLQRLTARKTELESKISSAVIDKAPIEKLQKNLAKEDVSSAYDARDVDTVNKYLEDDRLDDDVRIEREIEAFQEELQDLQAQGLISNEELNIINNLSDIDKEAAIYDNVLFNAKICLTRG